jgi:hypothetical protein
MPVTLRDPNGTAAALSAGDLSALEPLVEDREECGEGVSRAALEVAGFTHHVGSMCGRFHARGYQIGVSGRGLYQLGHEQLQVAA